MKTLRLIVQKYRTGEAMYSKIAKTTKSVCVSLELMDHLNRKKWKEMGL